MAIPTDKLRITTGDENPVVTTNGRDGSENGSYDTEDREEEEETLFAAVLLC